MDEGVGVRAIFIGASVFISLVTITAVLTYYNAAKQSVSKIGTGVNIEQSYRNDIENSLLKNVVTGYELKNILRYFYMNESVRIDISSVPRSNFTDPYEYFRVISNNSNQTQNINNDLTKYNDYMSSITSNDKYTMTKDASMPNRYIFKSNY